MAAPLREDPRTDRLALLQEVTAAFSVALTSEQVAEVVLNQGIAALGAVAGTVGLVHDRFVDLLWSIGYDDWQVSPYRRFPLDAANALADAARLSAPVWLEEPSAFEAYYPTVAASGSYRTSPYGAWASVPLIVDGETVGVLGLSFPTPHRFTEEDRGMILALAGLCAQALRRSHLYEAERRARSAAEDSAIQFRLLAETLPQIIWTALPSGQVEYYNRRWYEYTGRPPGELDGWDSLVPEEDRDRLRALHAERSLPHGFQIEYRLRRADGAYRWQLLRGSPHLDSQGRVLRWIGTSADIHDRILADRERERLLREVQDAVHARDEFIAVASHDLRSPAMALQLQLDALARLGPREGLSQPLIERVERARCQVARMTVLLNNLLDTSRIAAGQLRLEAHQMDLSDLAREVVGRFAADMEEAQCAARVQVPGPVLGFWDRLRLDQVLTNLLSNAVKYGAGHPIDVSVVAPVGERSAVLHVQDRGIGIPREQQGQIFDRFQRAVEERAYAGSGLGLWIVRQIVEAHGGRVGVESAPGEGARFTVELPWRHGPPGDEI